LSSLTSAFAHQFGKYSFLGKAAVECLELNDTPKCARCAGSSVEVQVAGAMMARPRAATNLPPTLPEARVLKDVDNAGATMVLAILFFR